MRMMRRDGEDKEVGGVVVRVLRRMRIKGNEGENTSQRESVCLGVCVWEREFMCMYVCACEGVCGSDSVVDCQDEKRCG